MPLQFGWLFTNTLFLTGVVGGVLSPFVGLMAFYTFSILRPTFLWFWVDYPTRRYSFYLGLTLLTGWVLSGFGDWGRLHGFWFKASLWGLILYLAAGAFAAAVFAVSPSWAWETWILQFKILLIIILTVSIVREDKQIRIFGWIVTVILGYLSWVFNSQYYFERWNRILLYGFGSVDNNGAAMIMVLGVPLTLYMAMYDRRLWVKLLCLGAALSLMHVVYISFSRGAMLGLVVVVVGTFTLAMIHLPNKLLTLSAAVGFMLAAVVLAGGQVRQEFMSIFADPEVRDASAESRFYTWAAAWRCMVANPLGVGPRNFVLVCTQYGLGARKSVHNLFLQTGADYGVFGMIGLFTFYFGSMMASYLSSLTPTAIRLHWPRFYGQMVTVSLSGFMICSIFIGMEAVEAGYVIGVLGLCTSAYVTRVSRYGLSTEAQQVLELEEVPSPDQDEEDLLVGAY